LRARRGRRLWTRLTLASRRASRRTRRSYTRRRRGHRLSRRR
jgi:hypothetical protein